MLLHGHVDVQIFSAEFVLLCIRLAARTPVAVQLLKLNVDVLCVANSPMPLVESVKSLVIPGLCDQLISMSRMVKKNASQNPKVQSIPF